MNLGFPAQERPARNALTVVVSCVNRTQRHAASVTAYSVLRACPSIQCSTRKLHQQTTGNVGNEKELRVRRTAVKSASVFQESLWPSVGTAVRKQVGSAKRMPHVFRRRTTESKLLRRAWPMPSYTGSRTAKSNRNSTRQLLSRPSRKSKLWQLS